MATEVKAKTWREISVYPVRIVGGLADAMDTFSDEGVPAGAAISFVEVMNGEYRVTAKWTVEQ